MNELFGWMIVAGLAVNISAIYMLSVQIEKQTRTTLEFLLHSNEIIMARLDRAGVSAAQPDNAAAGAAPERRRADRRSPLGRTLRAASGGNRSMLPQRRLEDLLQS